MKSVKFLVLFLIGSIKGYSQFTINGRIRDIHDSSVPFANVLLLNMADSALAKGAVTDQDGIFSLENVSTGNFIIQSYMVGFAKTYTQEIQFLEKKNIDLEDIILLEDTKQLNEVVIKAEKPLYVMEMGKMIVNVSSSITSSGQTVIDVLEKSPGVFVNRQNGSFSIGGKGGVIVLMNGKRSRMDITAVFQMLEGINAGDIEKIEIMSVPPANYDADGDAGFINIVMKKGVGSGTNGSAMVNLGYGSGPGTGASLNLSHQANKLNLYGNYSYNFKEGTQLWNEYRQVSNDTETINSSRESDRDFSRSAHNYRLGFDYYLSDKTIVSGLFSGYNNQFEQISTTNSSFLFSVSPDTIIEIGTDEFNHWKHLMGNINFQHTFEKGQVLNANLDYLRYDNENPSNYIYNYFGGVEKFIRTENHRISKDTPINIWVAKIDYSMKIGETATLETGIKGTFSDLTNDIELEEKINEDWVLNDPVSSNADLAENILAAYSSLKININEKSTFNAGLRYEYTKTYLSTLEEEGVVDRKYGNLFPTLYLSRKINENNLMQFSYGRRITRPTFNQMAPWVLFGDPYTFFSGNANIRPTYTNNIKMDYSYKSNIFSLQYSHDKDPIFSFQPSLDPETNILVWITDNIDRRETISSTITFPFQITDWWEMQNNFSANWQMIVNGTGGELFKRNQFGFQLNTTQTFKLPKKFTLELAGFYMSPVINGLFNWEARGFVNLGIQKELNSNGTLRFSVNDIFETTRWKWKTVDNAPFFLVGDIKFDKRIFSITYTQKFGNNKIKGARKRSVGSEAELKRVTN
jgi:hypothetical protein